MLDVPNVPGQGSPQVASYNYKQQGLLPNERRGIPDLLQDQYNAEDAQAEALARSIHGLHQAMGQASTPAQVKTSSASILPWAVMRLLYGEHAYPDLVKATSKFR